MSRYIDADELKKLIRIDNPHFSRIHFESIVNQTPPADVVSRAQYDMLLKRFRHLLESPYIRSFDEWDAPHMRYKRDIKEADERAERHGHWYTYPEDKLFQCSNCEMGVDLPTSYCPFCGAKMDGKENDNADTV